MENCQQGIPVALNAVGAKMTPLSFCGCGWVQGSPVCGLSLLAAARSWMLALSLEKSQDSLHSIFL